MTFIVVKVQNMKGPHSAVELENEWEIKAKPVITTIIKKNEEFGIQRY